MQHRAKEKIIGLLDAIHGVHRALERTIVHCSYMPEILTETQILRIRVVDIERTCRTLLLRHTNAEAAIAEIESFLRTKRIDKKCRAMLEDRLVSGTDCLAQIDLIVMSGGDRATLVIAEVLKQLNAIARYEQIYRAFYPEIKQ